MHNPIAREIRTIAGGGDGALFAVRGLAITAL